MWEPARQQQQCAKITCSSSLSALIHLALKMSRNCCADTTPDDSRSMRYSSDLHPVRISTRAAAISGGSLDLGRRWFVAKRSQRHHDVFACMDAR